MTIRSNRALAALAGCAALALPAAAGAKSENSGHGSKKAEKLATYELKGTVVGKGDGTVTVSITKANKHGRLLRGKEIVFDVSKARLHVRDVNKDGARDLNDVNATDRAKVQARLPRRPAGELPQPVAARKAHFRPAVPEEEPAEQEQQQQS